MFHVATALLTATTISPTPWPSSFSVNFYSNISWEAIGRRSSPITGTVQYDWSKQAQ